MTFKTHRNLLQGNKKTKTSCKAITKMNLELIKLCDWLKFNKIALNTKLVKMGSLVIDESDFSGHLIRV